jgi:MFS transporter, AAHS family, 4-hydroxybenzoate transporter
MSDSPPVDVFRLLDERPITALQLWVAVLSACVMLVDGYDGSLLALAVPSVAHEWQISPANFGLALSAALLGIVLAAMFVAPLGDRIGRRNMLVVAMALVGASTLLTATAATPWQFILWRLLTGFGLGMSIPNCNAWTAEYSPVRSRATILVIMNSAINAGGVCAGLIAPAILTRWGWRGTFLLGGALPLITGCVIAASGPESLKFLIVRRPLDARIAAILARIAPEVGRDAPLHRPQAPVGGSRWLLLELLTPAYLRRTLVLWAVVAANLFAMFLLINWLPTLLQSSGWPAAAAARGLAVMSLGGVVGGIALSVFLNRGATRPALLSVFALTAVCLVLFGSASTLLAWVLLVLIGTGTSGTQLSLNALATGYYPPAIKATGMSWAGVVGNLVGFCAPIVGGWWIKRGLAASSILAILCVPMLLCVLGVLLMRREWERN